MDFLMPVGTSERAVGIPITGELSDLRGLELFLEGAEPRHAIHSAAPEGQRASVGCIFRLP